MLGSTLRALALALLAALGLTAAAWNTTEPLSEGAVETRPATTAAEKRAPERAADTGVTSVVAVSIDGLNPAAIRTLGAARTPALHRLMAEGASTLNARTEREQTNTLPNHTGMLTGRRITAARGGHGVDWNDERLDPRTVQEAAGHPVRSLFTVVGSPARSTALFASKQKFSLFERSWDEAIDRFVVRRDNAILVRQVRRDIADRKRSFRFVHLSKPDVVGHEHRFLSPEYLDAVEDADRLLGRILAKIEGDADLADRTVLVVTSDHGGRGPGHDDPTKLSAFRVPFIVWGQGVLAGADLYDLNPDYADPGVRRTSYANAQPIRNGALANLVTDLLGLDKVPGSEHNAGQDLDVR